MICFIGHQTLPNFIPVNEEATRPDFLYAIFTSGDKEMGKKLDALKDVIDEKFPAVTIVTVPVDDAYDPSGIEIKCQQLIDERPTDFWSLNMTGGTKLMSSPGVNVFISGGRPVYYVDTPKKRILEIGRNWSVKALEFTGKIDLEGYFRLHGHVAQSGQSVTGQENHVYEALRRLDWRVWPSVKIFDERGADESLAEYDVIGIRGYQLSAFECKRLNVNEKAVEGGHVAEDEYRRAMDSIRFDLYKLFQVQQAMGGPFGKSYWVFSGKTTLREIDLKRIRDFRITLLKGPDIERISTHPSEFGLPPIRA